jgi:hypothetical protein
MKYNTIIIRLKGLFLRTSYEGWRMVVSNTIELVFWQSNRAFSFKEMVEGNSPSLKRNEENIIPHP